MKYRIKTEKEFEAEFGAFWRKKVYLQWNSDSDGNMDHLFGQPIEEVLTESALKRGLKDGFYPRSSYDSKDGWSISKDMIRSYNPKPNLRNLTSR